MKKYFLVIPVWTLLGILFSFSVESAEKYQMMVKASLLFCIVIEDFVKRIIFYVTAVDTEKYKLSAIATLSVVLLATYNMLLRQQFPILENEAFSFGLFGVILILYFFVLFPLEYLKKK